MVMPRPVYRGRADAALRAHRPGAADPHSGAADLLLPDRLRALAREGPPVPVEGVVGPAGVPSEHPRLRVLLDLAEGAPLREAGLASRRPTPRARCAGARP